MRTFIITVAVACGLVTYGCSGSPTNPTDTGRLTLQLKDSPYGDAKSLLVTFSAISAHRADSEFSPLQFANGATTRTCDLKKLETAEDVLGTTAIPVGHYTQIRLNVSSATLYFDNAADGPPCAPSIDPPAGRSGAVTIPSGEVRLNRQFTLAADAVTTILLDFDGDQSVHETSNGYSMTPVIAIVSVQ
jgi:hypothetical protein